MLKKLSITGLVLVLLGAILAGVGYSAGAIDQLKTHYTKEVNLTKVSLDDFSNLKLDIDAGGLEIRTSDLEKPEFEYNKEVYSYKEEDHSLTITGKVKEVVNFSAIKSLVTYSKNYATLYLPKNYKLETLEGELVAGDILISGLEGKKVELVLSSGSTEINNSTLENVTLNTGFGDIDVFGGSLTNATLSIDTGDLYTEKTRFYDKIDIDVSTGDINIEVNKQQRGNLQILTEPTELYDILVSDDITQLATNSDALLNIGTTIGDISIY